MDKTPFLTINFENPRERDIAELKRFIKDTLNVDEIKNIAKANLYRQQIKEIFNKEIENPSDEFIKFFAKQIVGRDGRIITQNIKDDFKEHIKRTFRNIINDMASDKIAEIKNEIVEAQKADKEMDELKDDKIITTEEELQAFYIVKSLFADRQDITLDRITYKDRQEYFRISLDDKSTKWIVLLYLNKQKKFFKLPCENGEKRIDITDISELYKFKVELNAALEMRLKK